MFKPMDLKMILELRSGSVLGPHKNDTKTTKSFSHLWKMVENRFIILKNENKRIKRLS